MVELDALSEQLGGARAQPTAPQHQVAERHVLAQQQLGHVEGRFGAKPVAGQVERVHARVVHEGLGDGAERARAHAIELWYGAGSGSAWHVVERRVPKGPRGRPSAHLEVHDTLVQLPLEAPDRLKPHGAA